MCNNCAYGDKLALDTHIAIFYRTMENYCRVQADAYKHYLIGLGYSESAIRESSRQYLNSKIEPTD